MTGRIATLMVIAILTAAVAAQQPQPASPVPLPDVTFTVDVNYVEVDALVIDAAGLPVKNLTADGFELLEDSTPHILELEARSLIEPVRLVTREIAIRVRE